MKNTILSKRTVLKITVLTIGVIIFLVYPFPLPAKIGVLDFRPYWSSSFLLAHGQDFSDASKLYNIERALTGAVGGGEHEGGNGADRRSAGEAVNADDERAAAAAASLIAPLCRAAQALGSGSDRGGEDGT